MFNIFSDLYLNLAFWTGVSTAALSLFVIISILWLRWSNLRLKRHEQAFTTLWRPLLMQALLGDQGLALPRLRQRDQWLFLKLWNHFQASLRGESIARLREMAYQLGCDAAARRLLKRGNSTERLFAILTLGHMQDPTAWEQLTTQILANNSRTSLYSAWALMQIDAGLAAHLVVPQLLQRHDWDIARVAVLLKDFHETLRTELINKLDPENTEQLPRALKLAHVMSMQIPPAILLPLLLPTRPVEVLISALRLAADAETLVAARGSLSHRDWRVRVQVAHTLGRIGQPEDVDRLMTLVQDKEWWVRYRAAQALADLPFLTQETLLKLRDSLSDRYALEIFRQVFAEHILALQQS